jgi:hypothetical protein
MERTFGGIFRKTVVLEMVFENRTFGFSTGLRGVVDCAFWNVRPSPKRKKKLLTP